MTGASYEEFVPRRKVSVEVFSVDNGYIVRPTRTIFRGGKNREESIQDDRIWIAANVEHLHQVLDMILYAGVDEAKGAYK